MRIRRTGYYFKCDHNGKGLRCAETIPNRVPNSTGEEMKLNVQTSADQDFTGICPACKEWTSAGESCCGYGARHPDGSLLTDEEAEQEKENPTVSVLLLAGAPHVKAKALHASLFRAGLPCSLSTTKINEDAWDVRVHVFLNQLPREE